MSNSNSPAARKHGPVTGVDRLSQTDLDWIANLPDVYVPYTCEVCDSELDVHGFCPTCETE